MTGLQLHFQIQSHIDFVDPQTFPLVPPLSSQLCVWCGLQKTHILSLNNKLDIDQNQ